MIHTLSLVLLLIMAVILKLLLKRQKTVRIAIITASLIASIILINRFFEVASAAAFLPIIAYVFTQILFYIGLIWGILYALFQGLKHQKGWITVLPLIIIITAKFGATYLSPQEIEFNLYAKDRQEVLTLLETRKLKPDFSRSEAKQYQQLWEKRQVPCTKLYIEIPQEYRTSSDRSYARIRRNDAEGFVVEFIINVTGLGDGVTSFVYASNQKLNSLDQEAIKKALCYENSWFFKVEPMQENWYYVSASS